MYKKRKINISLILILIITIINGSLVFGNDSRNFKSIDESIDYIKLMMEYIEENYKYDITEEQLIEGAYYGLFGALDQHSTYFSPEDYKNFNSRSTGKFSGIGLEIGVRDGYITVITSIEGTPAQKSGLKTGDIIKYVDETDVSVFSLERVASLIRGKAGSSVRLGIIRDKSSDITYIDIVRQTIEINPVKYEVLDNNIGYLKISSFNSNTNEKIKHQISQINKDNIKGIIIDLRNNPGGLLSEAIRVSDIFLHKDVPIMHIEYKGDKKETHIATTDMLINKPLIVLVNEGSASASEIFAGAIQGTKRGIIIGTQTYGKGTVQTITPITNGGGIKLTIAEYLISNGTKIEGIGVTPDIIVKNTILENKDEIIDFVPMIEDTKPTLNDRGINVYGAQQRLGYLGYDVDITGIMDEKTVEAIKSFQSFQGLYSYGILDWTTRDKIKEVAIELYNNGTDDFQLKKAIEEINSSIE